MNQTIGNLQEKISRLVHENTGFDDELRNAQENLRLSANQNQKLMREINDYKSRIEQNNQENDILKQKISKITGENTALNEEVKVAQ